MLEIGKTARLKQPIIEGVITDINYNKELNELEALVEYTDENGDDQQRWFRQGVLEEVA